MPILSELSLLVKSRRAEMGLTHARLAELAGLSLRAVSRFEAGNIDNLSLGNAEKLANVLGFGLGVTGVKRAGDDVSKAVETAARTASVSYADAIPPETLRTSIIQGIVPPDHIPQLRALLDEAPVGILSDVARQLERENGFKVHLAWQNMRRLAAVLCCTRQLWT